MEDIILLVVISGLAIFSIVYGVFFNYGDRNPAGKLPKPAEPEKRVPETLPVLPKSGDTTSDDTPVPKSKHKSKRPRRRNADRAPRIGKQIIINVK